MSTLAAQTTGEALAPSLQGERRRPRGTRVGAVEPAVLHALSAVLTGASPSQGVALAALARVRHVAAGQPVFSRQQGAQAALLVAQGRVLLGIEHDDGRFDVERTVQAPGWLDLASLWIDAPHVLDARAGHDSVIVELPRDALRQQLLQQPRLALRVIENLAQTVQEMSRATSGLMHRTAPARLAHWLEVHATPKASEPGHAVITLHERKRDLATQLAIAPETLSRLLSRFARDGVIDVAGYTVRVLDREALERLARW